VYSYDDVDGDVELEHFDVSEDVASGKASLVQAAVARQPDLRLFATAWSAPGWMKTSGSQVGLELRMRGEALGARQGGSEDEDQWVTAGEGVAHAREVLGARQGDVSNLLRVVYTVLTELWGGWG
jgi:hypothetical protein